MALKTVSEKVVEGVQGAVCLAHSKVALVVRRSSKPEVRAFAGVDTGAARDGREIKLAGAVWLSGTCRRAAMRIVESGS